MEEQQLMAAVEAILFISGDPVPVSELAQLFEVTEIELLSALEKMMRSYSCSERGITIQSINDKVQLVTKRQHAEYIEKLLHPVQMKSFSQSMLETLSIIAYKQPVTRSEIEGIRGVRCEYSVRELLECGLIKEVGRKETVGRPVLLGTTDFFLRKFNLASLKDLPSRDEFILQSDKEELSV